MKKRKIYDGFAANFVCSTIGGETGKLAQSRLQSHLPHGSAALWEF